MYTENQARHLLITRLYLRGVVLASDDVFYMFSFSCSCSGFSKPASVDVHNCKRTLQVHTKIRNLRAGPPFGPLANLPLLNKDFLYVGTA